MHTAERRVFARREGRWTQIGELKGDVCAGDLAALRRGVSVAPAPPSPAFAIGGRRFVFQPSQPCGPP
jgi:hypothetical protein